MNEKKAFRVCRMMLKWANAESGIELKELGGLTDFAYLAERVVPLAEEALGKTS